MFEVNMAYYIAAEYSFPDTNLCDIRSAEPERPHVNPILLFCRRLLEDSFATACQVDRHGVPTEDADIALDFLRARTDYSRLSPGKRTAIPREVRDEYFGSADWAAGWLSLPENWRETGLPHNVCRANGGKSPHRALHSRVRRIGRNQQPHIAGIPGVLDERRRRAEKLRQDAAKRAEAGQMTPVVIREASAAPQPTGYGGYCLFCAEREIQPASAQFWSLVT